MKHTFAPYIPTELRFGNGLFDEAASLAATLGRSALLVSTRKAMDASGHAHRLMQALHDEAIEVHRFRELQPSPTTDQVDEGVRAAVAANVDFIIALGGGSVLDGAKAIAGIAPGGGSAVDYLYGKKEIPENALPILAIPSLAGTGSELNRSAIITDPARPFKNGIRSDYLFPRIALVDPHLTHSASRKITAETGFDILTHAIESYVSPKAQPFTDKLSLEAIQAVTTYLSTALIHPDDETAREKLSYAGATMGVNLSCVGTCFPHRADKALCALYPEIAHGRSLALFYPHWANFSVPGAPERFAEITRIMDPSAGSLSTDKQAASFPGVIALFIEQLGLQQPITAFGVTTDDIPGLVERTAGDLSINPVPLENHQLPEIYREIITHTNSAMTP